MDLSNIHLKPVELEIINPMTGKPAGLSMTLVSAQSIEFRQAAAASRAAFDGKPLNDEEALLEGIAAGILAWKWQKGANWQGQKLECTRENKLTILREAGWVYSQVQVAFGQSRDFFSD